MKRALFSLCLCLFAFLTVPASVAAPLGLSIGAGYFDGGDESTGLFSLGVSRPAFKHFEASFDVAYTRSTHDVEIRCFDGPCPPWELETSVIPLSLGLIGYLRGPKQLGPYAEFSPSVYVIRSSLGGSAGQLNEVTGGFKVGVGAHIPIHESVRFDLGVLYVLSGPGDIDSQSIRELTGEDQFGGRKDTVPFARLSISLP